MAHGRVVMLVDNAVRGDSRVQKSAISAAQAGWEVILLGRSPDTRIHEWQLGEVTVRLLPLRKALSPRRNAWYLKLAKLGYRLARRPYDHVYTAVWTRRLGDAAWRKLEPELLRYEAVYGPVIDDLAPDLIHAHDFRMLGVGAEAARRSRAARLVWDAHEYLPGVQPWQENPRWLPAHCGYEKEFAPYADAVITVSEELADLLQKRHSLPECPSVILNAPLAFPAVAPVGIRQACDLTEDQVLLVYSGLAAHRRGLDTMIEALPRLASMHVAFVVNDTACSYVKRLRSSATKIGVAERVHVLPYVPHDQVASFLSSADVGVIPIHHWPNHEIALITKFFEYAQAGLPMVVSDVRVMADTTRAVGQGEVFRAGDITDYVRAVLTVVSNKEWYRAAYDPDLQSKWTWETQAATIDHVYRKLLGLDAAT